MTSDELDRNLRIVALQRPFRSFQIEFSSGDRLEVNHPEAVTRREMYYLFIGPNRAVRFFTAASVCQVLLPPPG